MDNEDNILKKRAILLTTRMRFSPEVQPIKQSAIDKILLQVLFTNITKNGLTSHNIQKLLSFDDYNFIINVEEIESSLKRLVVQKKVTSEIKNKINYYFLTKKVINNLEEIWKQADYNLKNILNNLFENSDEEPKQYYEPLLEFLCIIFCKLGEECVKIIIGDINQNDFISYPFYKESLLKIKNKFPYINHILFEQATIKFFQDKNYEFDQLKWNLAQSFYISKALGLDDTSAILSKEIFSGSDFYLDTNVIISALEPNDWYHLAFLAFNNVCRKLNIKLLVAQITLDELEYWLTSQYEIMKRTVPLISLEISSKINSTLYRSYIEKRVINKNITIDDIFEGFIEPLNSLRKKFNVKLVDDNWFEEHKLDRVTQNFALNLINKYTEMRNHPKNKYVALHDSLILLWIIKEKELNKKNIWLATLDATLPITYPDNYKKNDTLAVTLGALLQWMSPVAINEKEEKNFSVLFSEILKRRLLPREKVLEMADFLIFDQLNIACNELPSCDVLGCLDHIKKNAPSLNPQEPKDMIKLSYEVNKYFVDPARKFKTELISLEKKLSEAENLNIEKTKQFNDLKQERKIEKLRSSAWRRLILMIIIFVILEGILIFLSIIYGAGDNVFQKILSFWYYITLIFAVLSISTIYFLGKLRIDAMGWRLRFFFKRQLDE